MPVQARSLPRVGVDEQNARADAAVLLADEVARDDIPGQLVGPKDADQR
jgi:hypothetical protein